MKYPLRPYQSAAIAVVRTHLQLGKRRVVIVASTGAGKTVIACSIIEGSVARGRRILFLAHHIELITQCSSKLSDIGLWQHGIIKSGMEENPGALIQVASVQTITRRPQFLSGYDLIIIDEAHHATAKTYGKVLEANPDAYVLGLTATPYRADGKGLGDVFQRFVQVADMNALIADGFLVPPRVFAGHKVNLKGIKVARGDFAQHELEEVMNKPKITGNIIKTWLLKGEHRITVCFASGIEHSKAICSAFREAGVPAEHLDGETPDDERRGILARLARGETRIVSNYGVLTEGWDCPAASCIIGARPTKSRGLWRQMVGRVLRPHGDSGKNDCYIMDHSEWSFTHGWPTDPDEISLAGGLNKEPPKPDKKCSNCMAKLRGVPAFCPQCGISLRGKDGEPIANNIIDLGQTEGGLSEIERKDAKRRAIASRADELFFMDVKKAIERGYKSGWAAYMYKMRTHRWPSRELQDRARAMVK